jgi:hypothetical protein
MSIAGRKDSWILGFFDSSVARRVKNEGRRNEEWEGKKGKGEKGGLFLPSGARAGANSG